MSKAPALVAPPLVIPSDHLLLTAIMDSRADAIYAKDRYCRLLYVSRKMIDSLGRPAQELIGKTDIDLFGADFGRRTQRDDLLVMATDQPMIGAVESRLTSEGTVNWTQTTKLPMHDEAGAVIGLVGITREINEIRQAEMKLQHAATHDSLTDLPNRFLMEDRLKLMLARAKRAGTVATVLFMDIDYFKIINDTYGHDIGDLVLIAVAERLRKCVRESDSVSRIGGDEFVITAEAIYEIQDADRLVALLRREIARPLRLGGHRIKVSASIGVALYPLDGEDSEALLRAADTAMYRVKRERNRMSGVLSVA
jgi:diguanylate cyclase (GGDEF)-like protein/PAS domain S-box-containing protein